MAQINAKEWDDTVNHLIAISSSTLSRNKELEARLARAELELAQWQRHSASLQAAHKDQTPLILCVIDATADTFSTDLISQGTQGGREMGQQLARCVVDHLARENVQFVGRPSFWVTIYWNKAFMAESLVKHGECTADQLEQFCNGFSQSSSRFLMVDTGSNDNTALEKVKEYLDTYIRFPQTLRIFFGVTAHANRYLSLLTLLDNERYLDKLVLLHSRTKNVGELAALRLPTVSIDGVFARAVSPATPESMPSPIARPTVNTIVNPASSLPSPESPKNRRFPNVNLRPIDPTKPLHRQDPPPCNEYYLMTCTKGSECKYCHDFLLTPDELETLAANARKAPCNFLKKGMSCENGPSCCWGHECPNGKQCFHFSKGKCWFKADGMHSRDGPASPV